jgi:hypothetical protein
MYRGNAIRALGKVIDVRSMLGVCPSLINKSIDGRPR